MNKEELLALKAKIEKGAKYYIYDEEVTGPISMYEIEKNINTEGAIDYIELLFENLILYYSSKSIAYDSITLMPYFSLVIHENYCDENGLKEDKVVSPWEDIVKVSIINSDVKNGEELLTIGDNKIQDKEYIVSFSKFIEELCKRGFEYKGTTSFKEMSENILSDMVGPASIVADFRKKKNNQSLS